MIVLHSCLRMFTCACDESLTILYLYSGGTIPSEISAMSELIELRLDGNLLGIFVQIDIFWGLEVVQCAIGLKMDVFWIKYRKQLHVSML